MKQISFEEEEQWDKKKIAILIVSLVLIAVGVWYGVKVLAKKDLLRGVLTGGSRVLSAKDQITSPSPSSSTAFPNATSIKTTLQDKVDALKNEVNSLNFEEIASSSPQVQKALSDLKNIENYPQNQARTACENICKGL